MRPFDEVMALLKQGRVMRGFGNSPFPKGKTPMQELDRQRRMQMSREGTKPPTLRTSSIQELEGDNVLDPETGQMIPDFLEDGSPNPAAGPAATIKSMQPFDHAWRLLKAADFADPALNDWSRSNIMAQAGYQRSVEDPANLLGVTDDDPGPNPSFITRESDIPMNVAQLLANEDLREAIEGKEYDPSKNRRMRPVLSTQLQGRRLNNATPEGRTALRSGQEYGSVAPRTDVLINRKW